MLYRYSSLAEKYAPKGIRIRWKRGPKIMPAHAMLYEAEMLVPRPATRSALYVFLHECGHYHLKHFNPCDTESPRLRLAYTGNGQLSRAQEEYEAEQWAIAIMRLEGIKVPKIMLRDAKRYVRQCLNESRRGVHHAVGADETPNHVRKWVRRKKK